MNENNEENKSKIKSGFNVIEKISKKPVKAIAKLCGLYIILFVVILSMPFVFKGYVSSLLYDLNPFSIKQKAVESANNTADAFSTVKGVQVNKIPMNGVESIFNFTSKSQDNIQINVPKLLNYSPIFDDDKNRDVLKDAWVQSINQEKLKEETNNYEILYNSNVILEYKDGVTSSYDKINKSDLAKINKQTKGVLRNELDRTFINWCVYDGSYDVNYNYNEKNKTLDINGCGIFDNESFFGFKDGEDKVSLSFKKKGNNWYYIKNSLKVGEKVERI
ncbi:MAG: hypothetical protein RR601_05295 [Erysipelotrichales bacterium]